MKKLIISFLLLFFILPNTVFAGPTSTNFELKQYSFGSGGTENSTSANFNLFGITGDPGVDKSVSTNFKSGNGLIYTLISNVPPAPTFTNPANYYNKLKIVINQGSNATDAKYAIAISTDNFVSDTKYVQSDNTVGLVLGPEDWQTYTVWGGLSGVLISGLTQNTTYTVKVTVKKGNFTQSSYGPTAQTSTIGSTLSFSLSTSSQPSPPFSVSIGTITPGSVATSADTVNITLSTNANSGGSIYMYGTNTGLKSTTANYTITSTSADLSSVTLGYGAQGTLVSQTSGGPMELVSPYNGSGNNVGLIDTNKRIIFDSTLAPVTSGNGSFQLKAKAAQYSPAATDYADTLTIVASADF